MKKTVIKRCFCLSKGFALLELLVVVLIIGVLAAVALPQYQTAVEKARMVEAVANVRAIASAHQRYYLEHGAYVGVGGITKLDVEIPGTVVGQRLLTKDWIYSPTSSSDSANYMAMAQRAQNNQIASQYYIYITQATPNRIRCIDYPGATSIQKKLCTALNNTGTL